MAFVVLLAAFVAIARLWHGSWSRTGAASLAPSLFALGALTLSILERRRGRSLPAAWSSAVLITLAVCAGGAANAIAPTLGSVQVGALSGLFWGLLIAIGWNRAAWRHPN